MANLDELKKENIADLLSLGRAEAAFDVYGLKGKHVIKIGLLEDGEMDEVYRRTKNLDVLTKQRLMQKEILVMSILSIDNEDYSAPEKKPLLRRILDNCSPLQTEFLFILYKRLEDLQKLSVARMRSEREKALSDIPEGNPQQKEESQNDGKEDK